MNNPGFRVLEASFLRSVNICNNLATEKTAPIYVGAVLQVLNFNYAFTVSTNRRKPALPA